MYRKITALAFLLFILGTTLALSVSATDKIIVLTFDDGPQPKKLQKLLPLLADHEIPGTFFVIGSVAEAHKTLLQEMAAQGHEIENHSYSHDKLTKKADKFGISKVVEDVLRAEKVITHATGKKPAFFRPPYWLINNDIEVALKKRGYYVMKLGDPDINTLDYDDVANHRSADKLITRVKDIVASREKNGIFIHIFVFHEHYLTADAITVLIPHFKKQGYQFMRLDEVL